MFLVVPGSRVRDPNAADRSALSDLKGRSSTKELYFDFVIPLEVTIKIVKLRLKVAN